MSLFIVQSGAGRAVTGPNVVKVIVGSLRASRQVYNRCKKSAVWFSAILCLSQGCIFALEPSTGSIGAATVDMYGPSDMNSPAIAEMGAGMSRGDDVGGDLCDGAVCASPDTCQESMGCDSSSGRCVYEPKRDESPCDDGDSCTLMDRCLEGVCVGSLPEIIGPSQTSVTGWERVSQVTQSFTTGPKDVRLTGIKLWLRTSRRGATSMAKLNIFKGAEPDESLFEQSLSIQDTGEPLELLVEQGPFLAPKTVYSFSLDFTSRQVELGYSSSDPYDGGRLVDVKPRMSSKLDSVDLAFELISQGVCR